MSKTGTLYVIGVLVLVSPFLGLPLSWLSILLPILGVLTLIIAQLIRRERIPRTFTMDEAVPPSSGPSAIS